MTVFQYPFILEIFSAGLFEGQSSKLFKSTSGLFLVNLIATGPILQTINLFFGQAGGHF
jgi:hypothetical protein